MSEEAFTLNVKGLDQLMKALKAQPPVGRVGILGGKSSRVPKEGEKKVMNNAEIGALYEYNDGNNPNRPGGSFLRIPIADHLQKEMEKSGALDKTVLADVIKSGSVVPWLKKIVVLAEGIVAEGFDTAGFGKWKPSDMTRKKNHQTLVETKQLREAITSEVKE